MTFHQHRMDSCSSWGGAAVPGSEVVVGIEERLIPLADAGLSL